MTNNPDSRFPPAATDPVPLSTATHRPPRPRVAALLHGIALPVTTATLAAAITVLHIPKLPPGYGD